MVAKNERTQGTLRDGTAVQPFADESDEAGKAAEAAYAADKEAQAVARVTNRFQDSTLADIKTFEQAAALIGDDFISAEDLGAGFALMQENQKSQLVGVPLIVLDWSINQGTFGPFVSMRLITQDGRKFVVNDGSTGICQQMADITNRLGKRSGLVARHGFRRSDYEYECTGCATHPEDGGKHDAHTYYVDTSA